MSISLFLDASQPLRETDKVMGVKLAQKNNTFYRYVRDATFVNRACVCDVFNFLVQYDPMSESDEYFWQLQVSKLDLRILTHTHYSGTFARVVSGV